MKNLETIGFIKVGYWQVSPTHESRLVFALTKSCDLFEVLYCFESEGKPYYFGTTDTTLVTRLNNYRAGKEGGTAGSTNRKIHKNILEFLNAGKEVNIYVLIPKYVLKYEGYAINIAKGLEFSLIKAYDTQDSWNDRGSIHNNGKVNGRVQAISKSSKIFGNKFYIKQGVEFSKGVVIFGKAFHSLLPSESCKVEVQLGSNGFSNLYQFTHSGTNRKINVKQDLQELAENSSENNQIIVEILEEKKFKIYLENN